MSRCRLAIGVRQRVVEPAVNDFCEVKEYFSERRWIELLPNQEISGMMVDSSQSSVKV